MNDAISKELTKNKADKAICEKELETEKERMAEEMRGSFTIGAGIPVCEPMKVKKTIGRRINEFLWRLRFAIGF